MDNFKSKMEEQGSRCEKPKKVYLNYSKKKLEANQSIVLTITQIRKNQNHWYAIAIYIRLLLLFKIILKIGF